MIPTRVELAHDASALVGESPTWDATRRQLLWVDIPRHRLHRFDPQTERDTYRTFDGPVSAIAPTRDGGLVLGIGHTLCVTPSPEGTPTPLVTLPTGRRINDGGCDPAGRFFAGTLCGQSATCGLYRLDRRDDTWTATTVVAGVCVSNGFDWSPDGARLYYVDTPTLRIDQFDYDPATGSPSGRRPFADLADSGGRPDGLTVDADGGVWVALTRAAQIRRYDADGVLDAVHHLPVPRVTSLAFGGDRLDELYVTTARDPDGPDRQPLAGALFVLRPSVTGRRPTPWLG